MKVLEFENVSRGYGAEDVLKDMSFSVDQGQVIGNITADDKVQLAETGSVQGDIRAPRVAIADGAREAGLKF